VILHDGKRSLFWSLIVFPYLSFTTVQGQKIGFKSCESIHFVIIANFHTLHVCVKRIFSCNEKTIFLCICAFFFFHNSTFFHRGYVIKDPLTRSAPMELRLLQATFCKCCNTVRKVLWIRNQMVKLVLLFGLVMMFVIIGSFKVTVQYRWKLIIKE